MLRSMAYELANLVHSSSASKPTRTASQPTRPAQRSRTSARPTSSPSAVLLIPPRPRSALVQATALAVLLRAPLPMPQLPTRTLLPPPAPRLLLLLRPPPTLGTASRWLLPASLPPCSKRSRTLNARYSHSINAWESPRECSGADGRSSSCIDFPLDISSGQAFCTGDQQDLQVHDPAAD